MNEVFHVILIKPSHYDDDGYPIQWFRSAIPSNTLAALDGLAEDFRARRALGENVEIRIHTLDETNRRIRPDRLVRMIRADGGRALIALVGVQSNQYPRAVDLALQFRRHGLPVCIGGFHVSGCVSMLPELPDDLKAAQDAGISLFAGEAEDRRLDEVLRDAFHGRLKPLYNHMAELPALAGEPTPILSSSHVRRTVQSVASFDLGRGCPYQCSFCTIINVQGRKSRFRSPEDLEQIIRKNHSHGIHSFFITDDNLARNKEWEVLFDRLIELREQHGLACRFTIQVDTLCHRIPDFIEKAVRAGVRRVFIGLENINPDNLIGAKKRQNHITEYRQMLQEWKRRGVIIYAGYIVGFPKDRKSRVESDIEVIKKELPIDILDLFVLTPLPGSEDHLALLKRGAWMDPDMNKYDLYHRVSHHAEMSDQEWNEAYHSAWARFYTIEHMETVMRRSAAFGISLNDISFELLWFFLMVHDEGLHPLDGGFFRRKIRRDRRASFALKSVWAFYPKYFAETIVKLAHLAVWTAWVMAIVCKITLDRHREAYLDVALTPVSDEEFDTLELFRGTRSAIKTVARQRKVDAIRAISLSRDAEARFDR
jgi:hypothetical protein